MWRTQFFTYYEYLGIFIAILAFGSSWLTMCKRLPKNRSEYAIGYYKYQYNAREDRNSALSEEAIDFLRNLTPEEEARVRRGLMFMTIRTHPPETFSDLAFKSRVSSTAAVLPFPVTGPYFGEGQFTLASEVEFLIDKGLVRQLPILIDVTSQTPLDLFSEDKLIRITPQQGVSKYLEFQGTTLARELILAGSNEPGSFENVIRRLKTRIFPDATIAYTTYFHDKNTGQWLPNNPAKIYQLSQ